MQKITPQIKRLLRKGFPPKKTPDIRNKSGTSIPDVTMDPERYQVYKHIIVPNDLIMGIGFVMIIFVTGALLPFGWNALLTGAAGLFAAYLIWTTLLHLHHALCFRGWQKKVPLKIIGWETLVNRTIIDCDLRWSNVTIKINMNTSKKDETGEKALFAVTNIFCKKANKKFYTRDRSADDAAICDPRTEWTWVENKITSESSANSLVLKGSANPEVIGLIQKMLRGNLSLVQKNFPNLIESVEIKVENKYRTVDIEIPTSAA